MKCICPECKNEVDIAKYPSITPGMVIECSMCGIVLLINGVKDGIVSSEIVDEGK